VVGKKLAQARARIVRAHCRVGRVTRKRSVARKRGRVLKQAPRPGRRLANHAKVNLVIGKGR
jgi:beta-lactam-binding protein with PASTA domain